MTEQDEVQPFRVTLELAEPVLVNRSVAFDGLLAHLHFLRTGDAGTAHHALSLADVEGVYQGSELLFLGPVVRRKVPYVMNPRWDRFRQGESVNKRGKPRRRGDACVAPTPGGYAEYDEDRPARLVSFHNNILSVCFSDRVYQGPRKEPSMKTTLGFLAVALFLIFPSDALEARSEDDHVKEWCTRNNGEMEHHFEDRTRVDCLTSTHVVEFKVAKDWQGVVGGVGQIIHYARMAERRPGLVLIVKEEDECKWVQRLEEDLKGVSVNGNPIQLWVVGPGESHCPLTQPNPIQPIIEE